MKNLRDLFVQGEDLHMDPTFHPFPKFPLELRLKVWKNAILDIPPRVICIQTYLQRWRSSCASSLS
jgi:hypothetical protein